MKREYPLAILFSLAYFLPALALFCIWMICQTGNFVCPGWILTMFPLSPWVSRLEWPWDDIIPAGIGTGPLWGRVFLFTAIVFNAVLIFGIGFVAQRFIRERRRIAVFLASAPAGLRSQLQRQWAPAREYFAPTVFQKFGQDLGKSVGLLCAISYAVFAVYSFIDALKSSGWFAGLGVELMASPWSEMMGLHFYGAKSLVAFALAANTVLCYFIVSRFVTLVQSRLSAMKKGK